MNNDDAIQVDTQDMNSLNTSSTIKNETGIFIKTITFTNGAQLELQDNSIVVFVGPNNSGKSLSLREIYGQISQQNFQGSCISELSLQRVGSEDTLLAKLSRFAGKADRKHSYSASEYKSVSERDARKLWKNDDRHLGELTEFFVNHLTTERRLADCSPADMVDGLSRNYGTHPIQNLFLDFELEKKVSHPFNRAFATDLVVHRGAGRTIPLYVGQRPSLDPGDNIVSRSYLDKIESLERLEHQGDGLKSFASLLLRVWTGYHSILLLDEPEAFLHPPQARAVGELISAGAEHEKQIFIATHSNDVIQGLLSSFPGRITVVRLQRTNNLFSTTFLESDRVTELWRDPILRYSNVLNGLFHSKVVITESDGDCKFYEAIAETQPQSLKTTFYTYAGGKHRIPTLVRALRALHVPVRSVVDFDIFADDGPIRSLIEAHGSVWTEFSGDISQLRSVIQSRKGWLIGSAFKARVLDLLKEIDDNAVVQKPLLRRLSNLMKEASPWDYVKTAGMAAVPSGTPTILLQSLFIKLSAANIFVVPEGELEGFCRSVGGHGPKWVENVLTRDLSNDPELENARKFVSGLTLDANEPERFPDTPKIPSRFDYRDFFHVESTFNLVINSIKNGAKTIGWLLFACFWALQLAMFLSKK